MDNEEKKTPETTTAPDTDNNLKTDQDSAWKDVIEGLFEPFTEFFFPPIHKDIDFSKGIEILDTKSTGAQVACPLNYKPPYVSINPASRMTRRTVR